MRRWRKKFVLGVCAVSILSGYLFGCMHGHPTANRPPQVVYALQYMANGETSIPEGAHVSEDAVVIKAKLIDPDRDQTKLQIELVSVSQYFSGVCNYESDWVPSETEVALVCGGLTSGEYKWRYRAIDFRGGTTPWEEFGAPGNTDFEVSIPTVNPPSGEWFVQPRVLMVIYNPILEADGGQSLIQYYGWNDPDLLAQKYIADILECSYGQVRYVIAERIEHDEWPLFEDGFRYTDETYKIAWESRTMHEGVLDYVHFLEEHKVREKVESGEIDEVWIFGFPWGWLWESCMAGEGAIWINGPEVPYPCSRPFAIMGFNYERDVDCMLENLGHRAECTLHYVYDGPDWWWDRDPNATHLWGLFTRIDKTHPGEAGCGTVHFAPNSESDYDWGNSRYVWFTCDDWLYNFPNLKGLKKLVNCSEWKNGEMRLHHL